MNQLTWDPEIDTPATIAVIGGGPIGIEAALYARFLGYFVMIFDAAKVGQAVLAWGDAKMDAEWQHVTSPLGLAALEAQGSARDLPAPDAHVSFREYIDKYLLPMARTDLLYESVQIHSEVRSLSRLGCQPGNKVPIEKRAEQEFRLLIDSKQRGEYSQLADIVLDCSGLSGRNGMAAGAGLAAGERVHLDLMFKGKVDILGKHRQSFAGKHSLLFGNNLPAGCNALDFARLVQEAPQTRVTWVLPKNLTADATRLALPLGVTPELSSQIQQLSDSDNPHVISLPAWGIESLKHDGEWLIRIQTHQEETLDLRCDAVINCAATNPDRNFLDAICQPTLQEHPLTTEPHYYLLGQKAFGAQKTCTIAEGLEQIRSLFALIGGRAELDLYDLVRRQQRPIN